MPVGMPCAALCLYVAGYSLLMVTYKLVPNSAGVFYEETNELDPNPTWIEFAGNSLYAIHEVDNYNPGDSDNATERSSTGGVTRWVKEGGKYVRKEALSTTGIPAHLAVDLESKLIFVTNYGGGNFDVFSLDEDGSILKMIFTKNFGSGSQNVLPQQESSHPHEAQVLFKKHVYIPDLGRDEIHHFLIKDSNVNYVESFETGAGCGPRHIVLHEESSTLYVLCEVKNFITAYKIDKTTGKLTHQSDYKYTPHLNLQDSDAEKNYAAEIEYNPNTKMIYISNRGKGAIISYKVGSSGDLTFFETTFLKGTWPRSFTFGQDYKYLYAVDQFKNLLEVFQVGTDGSLEPKEDYKVPLHQGDQSGFVTTKMC